MSKGALNRFLLKSSQIIIRFSHPGITVYQQRFFSSSLSLSSFPFPLNRSILSLRQQLKLVVGGQRCTSFPSTNSMSSSSCCYHFTTTATTTTTTTSKATTRNKTNISTRLLSNGTCILDNIPLDRYVDNYFTGIKDGGQTVYIIEEHKNNNSSLDNYQHASSEGNISWGFSSTLLWVNDPQYIHPTSGQRVKTLGQYSKNLSIIGAEIIYSSIDDNNNDDDDEGDSLYPSPPQGSLHSRGGIYCNHSNNKSHDKTNHKDSGDRIRRALLKIVWSSKEESTFDVNWLIDHARNNCIGWMSKEDEKEQIGGRNSFLDSIDDHHVQATSSMTTNLIKTTSTTTTSVTKDIAIGAIDSTDSASIRIFDYKEIMENENNLFQGMQGIFENGAILIRNSPARTTENVTTITREDDNDVSRVEEESIVGNLGKRFSGGKLSHGSLYGDIFHVQTKNGAENIAYTNLALPPHQDLTYYDSKPFLQLLHCVTIDTINDIDNENENGIAGGDSVLIDAIAAAEELRYISPDLFYILCKTEATFLKERHDVDMVSIKSHIVTDPTYGQVIEVNWSPPFEGPLQIHPNIPVEDYVLAYQAMECMLDHDKRITRNSSNDDDGCLTLLPPSLENRLRNHAKQYTWEYSLQKGDILVFNNQRMLHGRRSFISFGNTKRHLIGCYTDTMDTISRYRLLLRDRNEENGGYGKRNPGNGSRWM